MLPQLAKNGGWLKLMGEAQVEQKARQAHAMEQAVPESEARKAWQVRRTRAQEIARSKRRGAYGLAKAIMAK